MIIIPICSLVPPISAFCVMLPSWHGLWESLTGPTSRGPIFFNQLGKPSNDASRARRSGRLCQTSTDYKPRPLSPVFFSPVSSISTSRTWCSSWSGISLWACQAWVALPHTPKDYWNLKLKPYHDNNDVGVWTQSCSRGPSMNFTLSLSMFYEKMEKLLWCPNGELIFPHNFTKNIIYKSVFTILSRNVEISLAASASGCWSNIMW